MLSMILKMMFSVFGKIFRKMAIIVYIVDFYFTYMCILGLYFTLNKSSSYYSDTSSYIVINVYVLFINSVAFFMGSFKQSSNNSFDFITSLVLMSIATVVTVHVFQAYFPSDSIGKSKYLIIMISHIFLNVYWCYNTHLIVTTRSKKFYSNEYIYAYMCYWGDWFSNFWFSIVHGGVMDADDHD